MTSVTVPEVKTSRGETRGRKAARLWIPAADGRALPPTREPPRSPARRAPRLPPPSVEERIGSRGPRRANKRPGRAVPVPRAQPRPSDPHRGLPYPEPRPSQPQPRRCAGDASPAHAADSRPRSAGLSSGPAPVRSRRPLLKDRQAAPRTKPARGHMRPRRCQSHLAIQPGHPSRPIRGRAGSRCSARRRRLCVPSPAWAASVNRPA